MSLANPSEIGARPLRTDFDLEATIQDNMEFRWRGAVEESSTSFILDWVEQRLNAIESSALQKKRILRVAIELLQNLHHHAGYPKSNVSFEVVSDQSTHWWMRTENPVSMEQETYLKETLRELNESDLNQLREIQRNKIAHQKRSEHGGAGVGLNELIRKSQGQVFVEFLNTNNDQRHVVFLTKLELK